MASDMIARGMAAQALKNGASKVDANGIRQIKPENTTFLRISTANLFDGNYIEGYTLAGAGSILELQENADYHALTVLYVKPSTAYSVIVEQTAAEEGLWWLKIATSTETDIADVMHHKYMPDGAFRQSYIADYTKTVHFTTGENDHILFVQAARSKQPLLQIAEGTLSDFTVSGYDTIYPGEGVSIYSKEEVDALIAAALSR